MQTNFKTSSGSYAYRIHVWTSLIFMVIFIPIAAFSQGYLRADGKKIVNEKNENIVLRGVGLGGWMLQEGYMLKINKEGQQYRIEERITELIGKEKTAEFYSAWLKNHTKKADIDSMKAWGFNSVRLPMHFNLYTLPVDKEPVAGQDTWLEKGFAMTDSLLSWCKANQMYLILDLHAAPGGQGNDLNISDRDPSKPSLWESEENRRKTIALWRKLAERYANEPWVGAYDIINEPNWGFTNPVNDKNGTGEKLNAPLRQLMVDITKAIREVDSRHLVIIEGNGWGNNYNGMLPPWDKNMALSYHKYWTHNDQASVTGMIKARDQYNIPVWLGETGENSNVWFRDAIQLLESNNIGWCWWPLKKIGINNPLEVSSNPEYNRLVAYWNQGGEKPGADKAYKGLMTLAEDLKIQHNIVHRDVIDAMMRQPFSNETTGFKFHVVRKGVTIDAVDYDLGRNGFAYFDNDTANYHVSTGKRTPGNRGGLYRNDGVDINKEPAVKGSYYVSDMEDGEWLQYTIVSSRTADFNVRLMVSNDAESQFSLIVNGEKLPGKVTAKAGQEKWIPIEFTKVHLTKGINKFRVFVDKGGSSLKSIQF